jgi:cell division protein FtsI (penicillin-binding protein 3)
MENPKIAVLVVVDEPNKQHYGSIVAAPAFKAIAQKTLDYMHIAPKIKAEKLMVSMGRYKKGCGFQNY